MQESIAPLFEVRMELDDDGLVFSPSLDMGGDRSFLALIGSLVTDIFNVARLIPRLAKGRMNYKVRPHCLPRHQLPSWAGTASLMQPRPGVRVCSGEVLSGACRGAQELLLCRVLPALEVLSFSSE